LPKQTLDKYLGIGSTVYMKNTDFIDINCPIGSFDFNLFKGIVNQGIDSHLEAFTQSEFFIDPKNKNRFTFNFHKDEIYVLLRRLEEKGQEEYLIWKNDIALVANEKWDM
jgi:hypothetical protein